MLRKCTDEDISDEECKNVIDPFYDNFDEYVVNYIMPEVIAFYIASSFYRNAMWEATFLQYFNSTADEWLPEYRLARVIPKGNENIIYPLNVDNELKYTTEILNEIEYKKKYREIYSIIRLIRDYK